MDRSILKDKQTNVNGRVNFIAKRKKSFSVFNCKYSLLSVFTLDFITFLQDDG